MFIKWIFKFCLFLSFFYIPFSSAIISCRDSFSSGAVIVDFVRSVKGNTFSKNWEIQIYQSFFNWSQKDVKQFLIDVNNRVSKTEVVRGLKEPSFFKESNYNNFKTAVNFYENYIGKKNVNQKIKQSLGDFLFIHSFEDIQSIPKLLEPYVGGKTEVIEIMKRDLRAFSIAKARELKLSLEFLSDYLGRKELESLIKTNFRSVAMARISELQAVINLLENYLSDYGGKQQVEQLIKQDLRAFSIAKPHRIRSAINLLEPYWRKDALVNTIKKDFRALSLTDTYHIRPVINFLRTRIEGEKFNTLFKADLRSFALMRVSKLIPLFKELDIYLNQTEISNLMIKDLRAFALIEVSEFKPVFEFLEKYLGEKQKTIELLKKDFRSFSKAQLLTLKPAIEVYEKGHGKQQTVAQIQKRLRYFPLTLSFEN